MVGDYVTSNPGFETIIAHPVDIDSNLDGTPEGFKFSLDVYKMGTNTKLFSTPEQSFVVCPNGISFSGPSTFQKRISNTLIWYIDNQGLTCKNTTDKPLMAIIYAVNLSAQGKTPWVKTFTDQSNGIGILPDINKNGVGELLVRNVTTNGKSYNFYIFDGETGAALAAPKAYPTYSFVN